jgi:hypothetical protein
MKIKIVLFTLVSISMLGCSGNRDWKPAIDRSTDAHPATLARDDQTCERVARKQAETRGESLQGVGPISVLSSLSANALKRGAGKDASGKTAMFGAEFEEYQRVYITCLKTHGHTVY